jgi:hypothetical protein
MLRIGIRRFSTGSLDEIYKVGLGFCGIDGTEGLALLVEKLDMQGKCKGRTSTCDYDCW